MVKRLVQRCIYLLTVGYIVLLKVSTKEMNLPIRKPIKIKALFGVGLKILYCRKKENNFHDYKISLVL